MMAYTIWFVGVCCMVYALFSGNGTVGTIGILCMPATLIAAAVLP